jgi:hypothetical protein
MAGINFDFDTERSLQAVTVAKSNLCKAVRMSLLQTEDISRTLFFLINTVRFHESTTNESIDLDTLLTNWLAAAQTRMRRVHDRKRCTAECNLNCSNNHFPVEFRVEKDFQQLNV